MAKLKAPLFSFRASGKLANALVFFGWKGLNVVRSYVIPTNPKSTAQGIQRGFLIDAVEAIHAAEADETTIFLEEDKTAYALYGSTEKTPRTWFNQIVARWLIAEVRSEVKQIFGARSFSDPGAGQTTIGLWNYTVADQAGYMYCGTSKTSMPKKLVANGVGNIHSATFTGLTKGVKYFFQFRPTEAIAVKYVMRSGIYHHVQKD